MKQLILLVGAFLISATSYADTGASLNSLGSAWKAESHMHAQKDPNDITMVYGGQDISNRPTVAPTLLG